MRIEHKIMVLVSEKFGISLYDLCCSSDATTERFLCFLLIKESGGLTLKRIGKIFSKDHSSVVNGIRRLNDSMDAYPYLKTYYEEIKNSI